MKAMIKLESIGENISLQSRKFSNLPLPGASKLKVKRRCWVAKISGYDTKFKYKRVFLQGQKDMNESNSKGSRGIYFYYFLEPGIYEINEPMSWKHDYRWFALSQDGEIKEISEIEVKRELGLKSFLRF